jgi:hypothetical protein
MVHGCLRDDQIRPALRVSPMTALAGGQPLRHTAGALSQSTRLAEATL